MMTTESIGPQNFIPRPRKTFYHPNAKGTGTALRLELHPAHEETEGSIFATLAPQRSVTERTADGGVSFASFDWTNAICLKLDLMDLAQMLDVFHGLRESAGDGKGLFHRSANATAVIRLEHNLEPVEGYLLDVSKKKTGEEAARRLHFFLKQTEARAVSLLIEQALLFIAFGIPQVIPRRTAVKNREKTLPAQEMVSAVVG